MNENKENLVLKESNFIVRFFGILFIIIAFALFPFYFYSPKIFGIQDFQTLIMLSVIAAIIGLIFFLSSLFMMTVKDTEVIFDNRQNKVFLTEKGFLRPKLTVHNYQEINGFTQEVTETENNTFYENFIVLQNRKIKIPSPHQTDQILQNEQLQQIKKFIG